MSATAPDPTAGPPYRLRPATAGDAAWLYELHVACLKDYVAQIWGWDDAVQRRMFAEGFAPEQLQIVVVGGEDAGVVEVLHREGEEFIAAIEIAPRWQGRGVGSAVLRDIQAAAARAVKPVSLQVFKVNPARRLYERLGFAITGETATHYLMATERRPAGAEEGMRA